MLIILIISPPVESLSMRARHMHYVQLQFLCLGPTPEDSVINLQNWLDNIAHSLELQHSLIFSKKGIRAQVLDIKILACCSMIG